MQVGEEEGGEQREVMLAALQQQVCGFYVWYACVTYMCDMHV